MNEGVVSAAGNEVDSGKHAARDAAGGLRALIVGSVLSGSYYAVIALALPLALAAGLIIALLLVIKAVPPPTSALMVWRQLSGTTITREWKPLTEISPNLVRAVIASEDARFCRHAGIDFRELDLALARSARSRDGLEGVRGASTISMQLTKNLFLWPGRNLARKGLELAITPVLETVWSKRRILEVYLNIAEWGPGIFGAEAAARAHFGKPASRLTRREAALLAAVLPNPLGRTAGQPGPKTARYARRIHRRLPAARAYVGCVYPD